MIAVNDNQGFPPVEPIAAGLKGCCPCCGKGRLLGGFLRRSSVCESCGLDFAFADAAKRRAFPFMVIAGVAMVAMALWLQLSCRPPLWIHVLWILLMVAICLPVVRLVKGALVTLHYANDAATEQPGR